MRGICHLVGEGPVAFCGYAVTSGLHATAYCAGVYRRFVAQAELRFCQRQHLQGCLYKHFNFCLLFNLLIYLFKKIHCFSRQTQLGGFSAVPEQLLSVT